MLIRPSIWRDHVISTWKRFSCKFYCSVCSLPTTPALFIKLLAPYTDCFVDNEPFLSLLWGSNWSQIGKNRFFTFCWPAVEFFFGLVWELIHFCPENLYVICDMVAVLWDVMLCVLAPDFLEFGRTVCSHFQGRREYTASHLTAPWRWHSVIRNWMLFWYP